MKICNVPEKGKSEIHLANQIWIVVSACKYPEDLGYNELGYITYRVFFLSCKSKNRPKPHF